MRIDKDLVAASATALVLGILIEGESYGYAIGKRVHELSQGRLAWTDGTGPPETNRLHHPKELLADDEHLTDDESS